MSLQTIAFNAETKEFREVASFFRIMSTTGGTVDVLFMRGGSIVADAIGVSPGYSEKFDEPIDAVKITSAIVQTIQFVLREGSEVTYDVPPGGTLIFPATQGPYTPSAPAIITGVGGSVLLAAKPGRRKLEIQNNDPAITIWVTFDGSAPVAAPPSFKIGPGGSYSESDYPPTGQIKAIAVTTANPLVTVIEG